MYQTQQPHTCFNTPILIFILILQEACLLFCYSLANTLIHTCIYVPDPPSHSQVMNSCRLDNITEFLKTTATYETLSLSRIEGIETFNARFGLLVSTLKKKPYDPLEHRKPDFDVDYQEFKHQLADLEVRFN